MKVDQDESQEESTESHPLKCNEGDIQNEEAEVKQTFRERFVYGLKNITVEPTLILLIVPSMIGILTTQNLNLEKACRVNLNYSDEICDSLRTQEIGEQNEYEKAAQMLLASALAWRTYITATIPCIMSLFVGSWSDKTGYRKVFIIIPIIGQILMNINYMVNVFFLHELRLEVLVFAEACLEAFSGGWCILLITSFAYISAITTLSNRTFRMGLASLSMTVGFPIGMGLSGVLLKNFGYYGCYGVAMSLHILNAVYNIFVLKDPEVTKEQLEQQRKGFAHLFKTFFNFRNVQETFKVLVQKEPRNRRKRLFILLAVVCVLFGPMYGEISIMYMATRYRFNWDELQFSVFQTYNFFTHTIGTVFSILVFSKYLGWHDSILGILSTISKIASSFVYCFALNTKTFFMAPLVEILNGTSLLCMRSIISKLVEPHELGKINSIVGLTENLMPLIYVPLYTKVYTATMEVLPGAVFLLGASMTLPAIIVFFWLFYEHRTQLKKQTTSSIESPQSNTVKLS